MPNRKEPHEKMTDKSNGLSDTQEVLYQNEFNRADAANEEKNKKNNQ
ncbi:YfhE family protein [Pseudobacillus wudalianchiensis]|nr:YfhE family protein [Bacillus wudalianchiensis]